MKPTMNAKLLALSRRYAAALRAHVAEGSPHSLEPALGAGRRAVALGLETLELARIHEHALTALHLTRSKEGLLKRAEIFFTEAITPIVETHRAARQGQAQWKRTNAALQRRTKELATTNLQLKQGIHRRKDVEAALKKSGQDYKKLLKDSFQLQAGLRQLTRKILAAQEEERWQVSRALRDEIAQTLLGINVRLLTLQRQANRCAKGVTNEIEGAQRQAVKSTRRVTQHLRKA